MSTSGIFQEHPCNTWIKQSEGCAIAKHSVATLIVALSTITLIGGVLLVLAQQGVNLGGINSLAKIIDPNWVYIALGTAFIAAVIDGVYIFAQIRTYMFSRLTEQALDRAFQQSVPIMPNEGECYPFVVENRVEKRFALAYGQPGEPIFGLNRELLGFSPPSVKRQYFLTAQERETFADINILIHMTDDDDHTLQYTQQEVVQKVDPTDLKNISKQDFFGVDDHITQDLPLRDKVGEFVYVVACFRADADHENQFKYQFFKSDEGRKAFIKRYFPGTP